MTALIRINQSGHFSNVSAGETLADAFSVGDVASHDQIAKMLNHSSVRLQIDGFADGRGFSIARQLRLLGFNGMIEIIGDLLPDQLPMAVASGVDAILIRAAHAERCEEGQWQQKSATNNRFGYQRSVAGGLPVGR